MLKNKQFIRIVLAFLSASAVFAVLALLQGATAFDVFAKLTDGWIFGVLLMVAYDVITRLVTDKVSVNWVYLTMVGFLVVNVCTFSFASETSNSTVFAACLTVSFISGILAGLFPRIVDFVKAKRAGDAHNGETKAGEDLQSEWIRLRAKLEGKKIEDKKKYLYKNLAFRVKEDDICNDLDFTAPLIPFTKLGEDPLFYTVNAALDTREIPYELIESAKKYIDSIIG